MQSTNLCTTTHTIIIILLSQVKRMLPLTEWNFIEIWLNDSAEEEKPEGNNYNYATV